MKINIKPIEEEVMVDPNKVIMSKTNYKGIIEYANDYFSEICGYSKEELIGKPHNIIRHPDMPKVVFKIMWEKLHKGENLYAIVKNLTKEGKYYWVVTKFETSFYKDNTIISHYARRKAVPIQTRETIENIYALILEIEKYDVKLAESTFHETLEKYGLTYDTFFLEVAGMTESEVNDYFKSKNQNINIKSEDIIEEIENNQNNNFLGNNKDLINAIKLFKKSNHSNE